MTAHHAHTADCKCSNELDELGCIIDSDTDLLMSFRRVTVHVETTRPNRPNLSYDVHTFTDTDDDAISLVLNDDPSLAYDDTTLTVTFRDDYNLYTEWTN